MKRHFDLLVVGGGFGGSLISIIGRRLGLSVLLLDRGRHPRFAIGESSTPAGNMILASLCERYDMERIKPLARYGTWKESYPELDVGPKRGFSYFSHGDRRGEWSAGQDHANELLVAASDSPWHCDTHWYRADVDAFLFAEAGREGAETRSETTVTELLRTPSLAVGGSRRWQARLSDSSDVTAEVLVDATGGSHFANRFLELEEGNSMRTNTSAAFAHYEGMEQWRETIGLDTSDHPFPCDHAALHHLGPNGWMWQLRFDSGRASVGLVIRGGERPDLSGWIGGIPSIARQMRPGRLVAPAAGVQTTGRLQRRLSRAGGQSWALLPSAAGFVDPLHSTGIAHTLAAIERIASNLESGSGDFGDYGKSVLAELEHLDRLVAICYQTLDDFRAFTAASMLYFAASILYERARATQRGDFKGLFLGADIATLQSVTENAFEHTGNGFESWVRRAIDPWNDAGLLTPEISNMYPHTVAPNW